MATRQADANKAATSFFIITRLFWIVVREPQPPRRGAPIGSSIGRENDRALTPDARPTSSVESEQGTGARRTILLLRVGSRDTSEPGATYPVIQRDRAKRGLKRAPRRKPRACAQKPTRQTIPIGRNEPRHASLAVRTWDGTARA